jgi:hypothetical protein
MSADNGSQENQKAAKIRQKPEPESILRPTFAPTRHDLRDTLWDRDQQGSGLLQRQCACGTHTIGGSSCDACRQKQESFLQRTHTTPITSSNSQIPKTEMQNPPNSNFTRDISQIPLHANTYTNLPSWHNPIQRQELEQVADQIALEHAAPFAGSDWFAERPGLDVVYAKQSVGEMLGANLSDVSVRPTALSGSPAGALARTRSRTVEVEPEAFRPGTAVGQLLLAHELTHVVQQSPTVPLPQGPGEAHRDQSAPVGKAPAGMAQHTISCSNSCQAPPAPMQTTFSDVQRVFRTSTNATERSSALDRGIATARQNANQLYRNAARPPVSTIRERYERETGISISYDNPLVGVSRDDVERAYRAWAENPTQSMPPWVLLAIWVKEGLPNTDAETQNRAGIPANSEADARAIYRSLVYFMNMGADVYIAHTAVAGDDNDADFAAGTGAAHDTAFTNQITRQVSAGRLPRDISGEINAELTVAPLGGGRFHVTATPRFQELSLMLVDAFYREQRDALAADPRVGANPDPGLVYMRWNMRSSSFNAFLNRPPNTDPDGTTPSLTDWAFHRQVRENEYGQSRRNAIRFKYLLEVFQHVYEGTP